MITKSDCILLLSEIKDKDTTKLIRLAVQSTDVDLSVIKFINDNRGFELQKFYEKLRKSYNEKKSALYKNIVKELDTDNISEILTTLSSYVLQMFLFSAKLDSNKEMFLKHARAEECTKALNMYCTDYNLLPCLQVLKAIKADIKAFEYLK